MKKAKSFFFWGTVCCCLFCFLQIWYPFYFYYVEQLQVFPLTWACFEETCRQPGGLACWLGGFLLQFYHLPLGGALVSTGLFLGIGVLMQRICRQTTSPVFCYLPALCPILALLPLHVDVNYRLQGTVAYCCMLGAFVLYVRIVVPWKRVLAEVTQLWQDAPQLEIVPVFSGQSRKVGRYHVLQPYHPVLLFACTGGKSS